MKRSDKVIQKDQWQSDHSDLRNHLVENVRPEARAAQLLYAFMRGVPRNRIEGNRCLENDYDINDRVIRKHGKYCRLNRQKEKLEQWLKE